MKNTGNFKQTAAVGLGVTLVMLGASACSILPGGYPIDTSNGNGSSTSTAALAELSERSVKIDFSYANFYSLSAPKSQNSCAGDANTYLQALGDCDPTLANGACGLTPTGTGASKTFSSNPSDSTSTLKPSFLKNVSVDVSDSNAPISLNLSQNCSMGTGGSVPPPSSCATFDYGSIEGLPPALSGGVILVGGVNSANFASVTATTSDPATVSLGCGPIAGTTAYTQCSSSAYALGVETLAGSTSLTVDGLPSSLTPGLPGTAAQAGPISSWLSLGGAQLPQISGHSMGFSSQLASLILFGGTEPLSALGSNFTGSDVADVWTFDLKTQSWLKRNPPTHFASDMMSMIDNNAGVVTSFQRGFGPRSLFGMLSTTGFAVSRMSSYNAANGGNVSIDSGTTFINTGNLDITERILAIGGLTDTGVSVQSQKFNPTFGPELVDLYDQGGSHTGALQYVENYHTQALGDSRTSTQLLPDADTQSFSNFGATAAKIFDAADNVAAGFAVMAGGFPNQFSNNQVPVGVTSPSPLPPGMNYTSRDDGSMGARINFAQIIAMPNDTAGTYFRPAKWAAVNPTSGLDPVTNNRIPFFGGSNLVPGFNLKNNDMIFFGGTTCRDYLADTTVMNPACSFQNQGRYLAFNTLYVQDGSAPGNSASNVAVNTASSTLPYASSPRNAGMAAARGYDGANHPIVIAWGGMTDQVLMDNSGLVWILYSNAGTPTWKTIQPPLPRPSGYANSSMVYSHVTGKYYLFGGMTTLSSSLALSDTWELSIQGDCTIASPACTGTWRQLVPATSGGTLTCSPNCPPARRSHRMVETNYAYKPGTTIVSATHESSCTNDQAPCSYGIFLYGGSPDGFSVLSDRWLFDPTANNGGGHWQKMDDLPPRHFSQMTVVEYTSPSTGQTFKRAVMFGGETGLQNPSAVVAGNFFVPPTLGDSWIYDLETNEWDRAKLMGKGYYDSTQFPTTDELDIRQSYAISTAGAASDGFLEASSLTPPPLAGGVMVTRTLPSALSSSTTTVQPLVIPEVFMFGGRKQDGTFMPLTETYKFCIGTSGERISTSGADPYDNAECDHYDGVSNPASPSPTAAFIGRWLRKSPKVAGSASPASTISNSYLGAGTYDPVRDRIYLLGGISNTTAVTEDSSTRTALGMDATGTAVNVLQYTPPSKNYNDPLAQTAENNPLKQGAWDTVANCGTTPVVPLPVARYGHNMNYDASRGQLIMIGGYDLNGDLLTTSVPDGFNSTILYSIPEVWTGKWIEDGTAAGTVLQTGVTLTAAAPAGGCFYWSKKGIYGNSFQNSTSLPPLTGVAHAQSVILPPTGFNTGYYSMFDAFCKKANPLSTDPEISRQNAGGAYLDIDRTQLGSDENLLLNLTFIPLGLLNQNPDGSPVSASESAVLEVNLVKTGLSEESVKSIPQPRYVEYTDTGTYPSIVQSLSVLSAPTGEVRQEQMLLPISIDPSIDRIWIRRKTGSAILIDATLYRMKQGQ